VSSRCVRVNEMLELPKVVVAFRSLEIVVVMTE
jgi:hypothetical protein